jgi:hypothetical protein
MPLTFKDLLRAILSGSASTPPSFTVLFEPLTNSTGTVTTQAYINAV